MVKGSSKIGLSLTAVLLLVSAGVARAFDLEESRPFEWRMRGAVVGDQHNPDVAWNGEFYLVVWDDHRDDAGDIYASRIAADGTILDPDGFAISKQDGEQRNPAIASCLGDGTFLVVWQEKDGGVFYNRIDAMGTPLDGNGVTLAGAGGDIEVAASASGFGVVWVHQESEATPRELLACEVMGGEVGTIVTAATLRADEPAIESDGDRFLLLWSHLDRDGEGGSIRTRTMDGGILGVEHTLGQGSQTPPRPKAAFSGGRYLVTWPDSLTNRITPTVKCVLAASDGSPIGVPVALPGALLSSYRDYAGAVSSIGDGFMVAWQDGAYIRGLRCDVSPNNTLQFSQVSDLSGGANHQDPEFAEGSTPDELLLVWEDHDALSYSDHEEVSGKFLHLPASGNETAAEPFRISGVFDSPRTSGFVVANSRSRQKMVTAWRIEESAGQPHLAAGLYMAVQGDQEEISLQEPFYLGTATSNPSVATSETMAVCGYVGTDRTARYSLVTETQNPVNRDLGSVFPASAVGVAVAENGGAIIAYGSYLRSGEADIRVYLDPVGTLSTQPSDLILPLPGDQMNPLVASTLGLVFVFFEQANADGSTHLYLVRLQQNLLATGGFAILDSVPRLIAPRVIPRTTSIAEGANEVMVTSQTQTGFLADTVSAVGALSGSRFNFAVTNDSSFPFRIIPVSDGANFTVFWDEEDEAGLHTQWVIRMASPVAGAFSPNSLTGPKKLKRNSEMALSAVIPHQSNSSWTLINARQSVPESFETVVECRNKLAPSLQSNGFYRYVQIRMQPNTLFQVSVSNDLKSWIRQGDVLTDYRGLTFWREPNVLGADRFFRLDRNFWSVPAGSQ